MVAFYLLVIIFAFLLWFLGCRFYKIIGKIIIKKVNNFKKEFESEEKENE